MNISIKKIASVCLAAAIIALSVCGCGAVEKITDKFSSDNGEYVFQIGKEKCSPQESKIILMNYQKQYDTLYGIDMWAHDYGDNMSLEEYVKDLTLSQLAEVYTLNAIAVDRELTLSEEEISKAGKAASEYYDGLASNEKSFIGGNKEDVQKLYERYALAMKLYQQLTANVEAEVSDDEARVMRAKQIYTTDPEKASKALQKLQDGSDFDSLASSYNESDVTDITIDRSKFSEDIINQIFSLEDEAYSQIIEADDGYYIFYCVKAFDPDLTEARKADVLTQRMEDAVSGTYNAYVSQTDSSINETVWQSVTIDTSLELNGSSFFEVYNRVFIGEE